MNLKETYEIAEYIKNHVDLVEMAQELGIEVNQNGRYFQSKSFIDPGNNNKVVTYNFEGSNLWHDFKTEETGDVIKLYAIMKFNGDRKQAFKELMKKCHITSEDPNYSPDLELIQDKKEFLNNVNSWHQALQSKHREYLHSRGITDETIDTLKIGYNSKQNRIMIPYYLENDRSYNSPVYACGRLYEDDTKSLNSADSGLTKEEAQQQKNKKKYPKYIKQSLTKIKTDQKTGERISIPNKYLKNVIWGLDTLSRKKNNLLIIAEGAFDALSFWQEGYAVISPLTTSFNSKQLKELPSIFKHFHEVMIILDNDETGRKRALVLAQMCFDNNVEFSISFIDRKGEIFVDSSGKKHRKEGLKDVSDYYQSSLAFSNSLPSPDKEKITVKENSNQKKDKKSKNRDPLRPLIDRRQNGITYLCQHLTNRYRNYGKRYDEIEEIISYAARFFPDRYVRPVIDYFKDLLSQYFEFCDQKESVTKEIKRLKNRYNHLNKDDESLVEKQRDINDEIYLYNEKLKKIQKSIDKLKSKIINKGDLQGLEHIIQKGPRDDFIINEILKDHQFLYDQASGFFEFNGLAWRNRPDEFIQNIIGNYLGKFNRGRHSLDIMKALQAKCFKEVEFNTKEVVAFTNCVLDCETGIVQKKGNPEDYSTHQLDFKYDKEAQCPNWNKFINDITANNLEKNQLLKEAGGYVLINRCKFQTCIYLIGGGSNGKSLYLNMIENVYGHENTIHVPLAELKNEFKRISFQTALLNISPDDTGSLPKESLGFFKNIVAADPIDGAKKHKDSKNFRPRAKILIASESLPKTKDVGYGTTRRFIFINFPVKFVKNPNPDNINEKEIDPDLEEKLKLELPGIFNFFYEGYQDLRDNNGFTETKEEKIIHNEFKKLNDPVFEFLEDVDLSGPTKILNQEAYQKFVEWCSQADYDSVPLGQKSFSRKFRKEFLKMYPEYKEYNASGKRGVIKKLPEQLQ